MMNPQVKKEIQEIFCSTFTKVDNNGFQIKIGFESYEELSHCKTSLVEAIEQIMLLQYHHDADSDKAMRTVLFLTKLLIQLDLTQELSNLDDLLRVDE